MIIIPLKLEGGHLNYSSAFEGAVMAENGNDIELADICTVIKNQGYTPAACVNAMQDNLYPVSNKDSGFLLNSNKSIWYDKQGSDGKPWLNPASGETKKYLAAISGEIAAAGFEYILCTNMEYPPLSGYALEDIG